MKTNFGVILREKEIQDKFSNDTLGQHRMFPRPSQGGGFHGLSQPIWLPVGMQFVAQIVLNLKYFLL